MQQQKEQEEQRLQRIKAAKEEAAGLRAQAAALARTQQLSQPIRMRTHRWPHRWKLRHLSLDEGRRLLWIHSWELGERAIVNLRDMKERKIVPLAQVTLSPSPDCEP